MTATCCSTAVGKQQIEKVHSTVTHSNCRSRCRRFQFYLHSFSLDRISRRTCFTRYPHSMEKVRIIPTDRLCSKQAYRFQKVAVSSEVLSHIDVLTRHFIFVHAPTFSEAALEAVTCMAVPSSDPSSMPGTCLLGLGCSSPVDKFIILLFSQQTEPRHLLSMSTNFHVNRRKIKKIKITHYFHYNNNQPKIPLCLIKNHPPILL